MLLLPIPAAATVLVAHGRPTLKFVLASVRYKYRCNRRPAIFPTIPIKTDPVFASHPYHREDAAAAVVRLEVAFLLPVVVPKRVNHNSSNNNNSNNNSQVQRIIYFMLGMSMVMIRPHNRPGPKLSKVGPINIPWTRFMGRPIQPGTCTIDPSRGWCILPWKVSIE